MKQHFDNPTRAIQSFGSGGLDLDSVVAAFDDFLSHGVQVEDLVGAVAAARDDGVIDDSQKTQLDRAIADTMTVFAGHEDSGGSGQRADSAADAGATAVDPSLDSQTRIAEVPAAGEPGKVAPGVKLRDRFIIDEVLGVGGMGTVYRGRDSLKLEARDRNPYLAIKVLNESFAKRPDAFIALQREASRQQRLAHPNIATVFDFDRSGGTMFITMELLEGKTLDKYIRGEVRKRGGLPVAEAMPIIQQLCAALSHAHQRGIVHADFKPGNCFLTKSDEVKVLDFGIARAMKDPSSSQRDQTIFDPRSMGALTPAYASPEMLDNSMNADPRDDLYALACVTYELLAGIHPFKRVPADEARDQGMVPERIKALSRRQNATLMKGLAFEREERIASADDFLAGIRPHGRAGLPGPLARAAAAVVVLGLLGFIAVQYFGSMQERRLEAALASGQPAAVLAAVAELQALPPARQLNVVSANRDALLTFFEDHYQRLVEQPPAELPFADAAGTLATATALMPDSASLRDLMEDFERRRASYLSELTDRFETYLRPDYLVPVENREDLHDLLSEVAEVDPDHPLLTDLRVATAYAESAEEAVQAGDLDAAQQIVNSGLMLRVDDPALLDIEDRINALRAEARRREEVARLEQDALARVGELDDAADLTRAAALLAELEALAPQSEALAQATETGRAWVAPRVEAALAEQAIPAVATFLAAYAEPLRRLGATDLLTAVEEHQGELVARRSTLVDDLREELASESAGTARRDNLAGLLGELTAIDPLFFAESTLAAEVLEAQTTLAEQAAVEYRWDEARAALETAGALDLGEPAERTVARELGELAERQRLFDEQLAAERATEAERRRVAAVAAAERRLRSQLESLSFDATGANAVMTAARGLTALDPNHPLSERALQEAAASFVAEARQAAAGNDYDRAKTLVDLAGRLTPGAAAIADVRNAIGQQEAGWREQQRRGRIEESIAVVNALLTPPDALASAERQAEIDRQLQQLADMAPAAEQLAGSRRSVAQAYLQQGERLIADKRFSAAAQLLELAARNDPELDGLAASRQSLAEARESYRAERERLEREARIATAEQQFRSELASGQLTRAGATLEAMRELTPEDSFFHDEAPGLLATAYAGLTARYLREGDASRAERMLTAGRRWAALPDWDRLENGISALESSDAIDAWLAAPTSAEPAQVRDWLERHRQLAPEAHPEAEQRWIETAAARLTEAGGDPAAFNPLLARLRAVWPEAPPFAIAPLEIAPAVVEAEGTTPAPLDHEVLFGRWCGSDVDLEFSSGKLRFLLGRNQSVEYPVKRYVSAAAENILVEWEDPRNGLMLMEFGGFSGDRDTMLQLRGKLARDNNWQVYERSFSRCG